MSEIFDLFANEAYRFGRCSVLVYDRKDAATFTDDLLLQLYRATKSSRSLYRTFCGMADLSAPAICAYLASRSPLLLMCVDNDPADENGCPIGGFTVIGYAFPTIFVGPRKGTISPDPGRSMFAGYSVFKQWYRSPELVVCMMLAMIYYFNKFGLVNIQAQSYTWNRKSIEFMAQFGMRDIGIVPSLLFDGKQLLDSHQSCLDRDVFEDYVRRVLLDCAQAPQI